MYMLCVIGHESVQERTRFGAGRPAEEALHHRQVFSGLHDECRWFGQGQGSCTRWSRQKNKLINKTNKQNTKISSRTVTNCLPPASLYLSSLFSLSFLLPPIEIPTHPFSFYILYDSYVLIIPSPYIQLFHLTHWLIDTWSLFSFWICLFSFYFPTSFSYSSVFSSCGGDGSEDRLHMLIVCHL